MNIKVTRSFNNRTYENIIYNVDNEYVNKLIKHYNNWRFRVNYEIERID